MLLQKYILSIGEARVRKLSYVFICIYYYMLLFCKVYFSETKTISLSTWAETKGVFNLSNQLTNFLKIRGMQCRTTKFYELNWQICPYFSYSSLKRAITSTIRTGIYVKWMKTSLETEVWGN